MVVYLKKDIPHCRNNSEIKQQNYRKKKNRHTQIHDRPLSCLVISVSIRSDGVKLEIWVQISPLSDMKRS